MPVKKWLVQSIIALVGLFILFASVQYLKGRGLEYSIEFGVLWSLIATGIFFGSRIYYFRKGMYCKVCNDLPAEEKTHSKE